MKCISSALYICKQKVYTVMVNNSININKTNNHPSPQQYIWPRYITLEIQILAWDRHNNVSELNRWIGSHPFHVPRPNFPTLSIVYNFLVYPAPQVYLHAFIASHLLRKYSWNIVCLMLNSNQSINQSTNHLTHWHTTSYDIFILLSLGCIYHVNITV